MIRFIDLRGQDTGYRFAFFDTRVDMFLTFDNEQVWDTWNELEETIRSIDASRQSGVDEDRINRLKSLCPEWAFQAPIEKEELSSTPLDPLDYLWYTIPPDYILGIIQKKL